MTTVDRPSIDPSRSLGELVAERPARARVFEAAGLDYCCRGKRSLEEAATSAGVPVEAVIALSIAFVAAGVVARERGREDLAARRPWIVAFAFGLLHGFGFAGALAEVGLPDHSIPLALLFFNVGVEIGQLLLVGAVLLLAHVARRLLIDREWKSFEEISKPLAKARQRWQRGRPGCGGASGLRPADRGGASRSARRTAAPAL